MDGERAVGRALAPVLDTDRTAPPEEGDEEVGGEVVLADRSVLVLLRLLDDVLSRLSR